MQRSLEKGDEGIPAQSAAKIMSSLALPQGKRVKRSSASFTHPLNSHKLSLLLIKWSSPVVQKQHFEVVFVPPASKNLIFAKRFILCESEAMPAALKDEILGRTDTQCRAKDDIN